MPSIFNSRLEVTTVLATNNFEPQCIFSGINNENVVKDSLKLRISKQILGFIPGPDPNVS